MRELVLCRYLAILIQPKVRYLVDYPLASTGSPNFLQRTAQRIRFLACAGRLRYNS